MAADFDLEALGFPVVNYRDGYYWIVDGQHRIEALKMIGYGDQQVQCECYDGLSEAEEADLFLRRDERSPIQPFEKFNIGLTAEREAEQEINRVVLAQGLRVSKDKDQRSVHCVGALRSIYAQGGSVVLGRALRIARDAFDGDGAAFRSDVVQGIGLVCQRYNGKMSDERVIAKLGAQPSGAMGLLRSAATIVEKTGKPKIISVAQAVIVAYNAGAKNGERLDPWWKETKE